MRVDHWEYLEKFHEKAQNESPSGAAGLSALKTIRNILGPRFEPIPGHPLRNRFSVAYEPNYQWIIRLKEKLEEVLNVPGHEAVLARLSNPPGFLSAWDEIDFALRLRIADLDCRFIPPEKERTPDLAVKVGAREVDIEITSLNQPYEETAALEGMGTLNLLLSQWGCVGGGAWSRPPSKGQIQTMKGLALRTADKAIRERRVVELNIPGLLTYYVAPADMFSQLPEKWQGSSVMRTKSRRPKEDRLAEKVEDKTKAQLRSNLGILIVYDRFSSPDEMRGFFDHKDIELVIGTFKNLAGVALVFPFTALENAPAIIERKESRVYIRHSLSGSDYESCVIWGNIMANHDTLLERFVECIRDYPSNLARLSAQDYHPIAPRETNF